MVETSLLGICSWIFGCWCLASFIDQGGSRDKEESNHLVFRIWIFRKPCNGVCTSISRRSVFVETGNSSTRVEKEIEFYG